MNQVFAKWLLVSACLLTLLDSPISAAVRVAIVESRDPYTKALGLSDFLTAEEVPFSDLSHEFEQGTPPDLTDVDLLVVGSFATTSDGIKSTYLESASKLRTFVAEGGVIAVLGQADQDLANETWVEPERLLTRADPDHNVAFMTQPEHPLLGAREPLKAADLRNWRVPTTWHSTNTIWEAFDDWNEAAVILGGSDSPSPPSAGLIEMAWGKGRAVFYAMAPDKAFVGGNAESKSGGTKLLRNLLAYAELVREGKASDIEITPTPGYKHPISGMIYVDENGNGQHDSSESVRSGVAVSDGLDVVLTDDMGRYRLPNDDQKAVFVYVHQPDDVRQSGQDFFHLLPADAGSQQQFDFGLKPAAEKTAVSRAHVRFVQLTDSHIRNVSDRDYMRQATSEIYEMQPPPDFVVATGDLVDWGVEEHYENYVAGMQKPPIPYFNVFGNHELVFGSIERYHYFIGPDYYSFERAGTLFLALNCVTPSPRQDAWLRRTLELLGTSRPVVAFQHFPPVPEEMERFAELGVKSVFSGHWHSEKEMEHAGVQSVNSPTFIMGGIDASPAGFKVVHLADDGSADTEWRYGFQDKLLTIVSPQQGTPVSNSYFPVLVNAYDTSVDVATIKWQLSSNGHSLASGLLDRDSAISWSGLQKSKLANGSFSLHVEATDETGETWAVDQQVEALPGEPATPVPGREWPMFMGDAGHTGFTSESISLPLRLAWSVDTGGDPDFSSPIFADGRLYLALKKRTRNRTNGAAAFDPITGKRLWLFETPLAINHTPAFAGGVLCLSEMGGRIYGVDAATGRELWQHDLIDDRGRYSYCAPAAHGGAFYAGVMRRMAKLRASDGHVLWKQQIGGADNDWISSYGSPAVSGKMVVMTGQFSRGDAVVAVNLQDGSKLWGNSADGGMLASATFAGDRVLFCGHSSTLYCQSASDGSTQWSRPLGVRDKNSNWSATTPAVKFTGMNDGIVVAGSGDGHMCGFNLADGKLLWTHASDPSVFKVSPYRRDSRPLLSSPTIAGDKVFFGSADGRVYCLDLTTGSELWSFVVGVSVVSTPLVTGNAVYVAAYDGRLYAFTSQVQKVAH